MSYKTTINPHTIVDKSHATACDEAGRLEHSRNSQLLAGIEPSFCCINLRKFPHLFGNVSGANQPLRANYGNSNLSHWINIQGVRTCPWIG